MINPRIGLNNIRIGNDLPIILIGGLNVIENAELTYETAKKIKQICEKLNIQFIFKASYDKANRSSINSYRGPGLLKGMEIFGEIKKDLNISIITDVHSPEEAEKASEICDVIQLLLFLQGKQILLRQWQKQKKS